MFHNRMFGADQQKKMAPRKVRNSDIFIDENLKISIENQIEDFINSNETSINFPATFTKNQRAYIHTYIRSYNLGSKSHGTS